MASISIPNLSEADSASLAELVAFALTPGDVLALEGDLGAGKTTFARALIAALSEGRQIEIPSPTFTLVQTYATDRFEVAHFDLYRLSSPDELLELGLDHALKQGVAIIEWPERGGNLVPESRFTLKLEDGESEFVRNATLAADSTRAARLSRLAAIREFLAVSGWGDARVTYLQGDASARRYARLQKPDGAKAILMDSPRQPDGPPIRDGLPYSQIAHLAEDVRPFMAIAEALRTAGFSAPKIFAHDLGLGLLIIEDFGDKVFGREVTAGQDLKTLWRRGTDVLVALRTTRLPRKMTVPDGSAYSVPPMDLRAVLIEAELLLDWYWPARHGEPAPDSARQEFVALWTSVFERLDQMPKTIALRDYHSPNLIALDERQPPLDVGIIDFQDALWGPHAYDLVSLLQDARLDVPEEAERELLAHYIAQVKAFDLGFSESDFRFAYAALGAQRNTKILGIFARLAKRDGKRQYLAHIPRIWRYLARDLGHPDLHELETWYHRYFRPETRYKPLII